jgi:NAD(P)-dependent dehydrogenase (short-subunit alcohol dehydrogenase family)
MSHREPGSSTAAAKTSGLAGRVALVTGGGHGIGRCIALRLVEEKVAVAVCGRSSGDLDETVRLARSAGGDAEAYVCDVSDPRSVERLHEEVLASSGMVDILVNNAGIAGPTADLLDIEPADWDQVMDINVRGVYLCCRAFLPGMVERGSGDVINMASVTGKRPLARRTPYCASKMAVIGLTRALAFEVGPLGVRVNSLSPGPVRGERMRGVFEREAQATGVSFHEAEQAFVSRAALHRLIEEGEVAEAAVAILCMSGLAGADLDLSGGMVAL